MSPIIRQLGIRQLIRMNEKRVSPIINVLTEPLIGCLINNNKILHYQMPHPLALYSRYKHIKRVRGTIKASLTTYLQVLSSERILYIDELVIVN